MNKAYMLMVITSERNQNALVSAHRMDALNPNVQTGRFLKTLNNVIFRTRLLSEDNPIHFQFYAPIENGKVNLAKRGINIRESNEVVRA